MNAPLRSVQVFPSSVTIDREAATKALQGPVPRQYVGPFSIVRDFACGLLLVHQGWEPFAPPKAPWVILIGDDLLTAEGPTGFHTESLHAVVSEAYFVAIVATEAMPLPYDMAATCAARDRQNAVIIDTRPEQKDAWLALVREVNPETAITVCVPEGGTDAEV